MVIESLLAIAILAGMGRGPDFSASTDVARRTCMGWPKSEKWLRNHHFRGADAVFVGTVIELDAFTATMSVAISWKGPAKPVIAMGTGRKDNGDGTMMWSSESYRFSKGESYLVYAYGTGPKLGTSVCSWTTPLPAALPEFAKLDALAKRQAIR